MIYVILMLIHVLYTVQVVVILNGLQTCQSEHDDITHDQDLLVSQHVTKGKTNKNNHWYIRWIKISTMES